MQQEKKQKCKWIEACFLLNFWSWGLSLKSTESWICKTFLKIFDISVEPQGICATFEMSVYLQGIYTRISVGCTDFILRNVGLVHQNWGGSCVLTCHEGRHQLSDTVSPRLCFANPWEPLLPEASSVHLEEEAQAYVYPHSLKWS